MHRRSALHKWESGRSQQMHNERLGQEALQEPVRLELADGGRVLRCANSVVVPSQQKGAYIDDGACRAKHDDETKKICSLLAFPMTDRWSAWALLTPGLP